MKKRRFLFFLSLILFFHISHAQLIMIDGETGEYKYEEVVSTEGISQEQIKERAKKWIDVYYSSIQSESIDSTSIQSKTSFKFSWKFIQKNIPLELFFDITVKIKENRYKYDFSNFEIGKVTNGNIDSSPLSNYIKRFPNKYHIFIEEPIDTEITKATESLKYFIENDKMKPSEDDW